MPIPDFVIELREKIGHAPLWLSGVTAVTVRGEGAEQEVLLVRRSDNGWWTAVTGIIDPGEQPAVAAARESLEEASVVVEAERLVWVKTSGPVVYQNGDRSEYLELIFRCRWISGEPEPGDDEVTEAVWCRTDALPEMTADHLSRIHAALGDEPAARFERQ